MLSSKNSRQPRNVYGQELLDKLNNSGIDINAFLVPNVLISKSFNMFSLVSTIENS